MSRRDVRQKDAEPVRADLGQLDKMAHEQVQRGPMKR